MSHQTSVVYNFIRYYNYKIHIPSATNNVLLPLPAVRLQCATPM